MIQVAFVGCAHIHTPGFTKKVAGRTDVKVKYVWDHDKERAAKRAAEVGAKVVRGRRKVWSDPEVAAVIICSETNGHKRLVAEATAARKHLFVEKPLGMGAKDGYAMAEKIEQAGVLFTTGYAMRTSPAHLFLKSEIAKGNLGRVTRIRSSVCHGGSLGGWFDTEWRWMAEPKIAGVGAFGDLGTHGLDLLMWLVGDVESVTGDLEVVTGRYGECDETGEAILKFKSGAVGTLAAGWVDVANPVSLLVSGTEGHALVGEGGLFYKSAKVAGADGKTPWMDLPPADPHPLDAFLDAVGGRPSGPLVSPREAAVRSSVMEAIYRAAQKRKWLRPK